MAQIDSYRYIVVDVFTTEPLAGNPLAVFPASSALDEATMQKIALELNLAETVFVLPTMRQDCAARVRIFTPAKEMAFAGHPTVGAAFVLLQEKIIARNVSAFMLEEQVGPVPLRIDEGQRPLIWLRMPPIHEGKCYDSSLCARVLGLEPQDLLPMKPQLLSAGNPTVVVAAKNKAAVDRAWLDLTGMKTLRGAENEPFCVYLFTPTPDGAYSRMFAPEYGISEDPASGSCMGPLAVLMMRHNLISNSAHTHFISEQGTKMGRRSLLHIEICGTEGSDSIYVGGHVTPIVEAVMTLGSKENPLVAEAVRTAPKEEV
jgi:trans-2,3-dihydro-3-hydroxyanthranilate isomerase